MTAIALRYVKMMGLCVRFLPSQPAPVCVCTITCVPYPYLPICWSVIYLHYARLLISGLEAYFYGEREIKKGREFEFEFFFFLFLHVNSAMGASASTSWLAWVGNKCDMI